MGSSAHRRLQGEEIAVEYSPWAMVEPIEQYASEVVSVSSFWGGGSMAYHPTKILGPRVSALPFVDTCYDRRRIQVQRDSLRQLLLGRVDGQVDGRVDGPRSWQKGCVPTRFYSGMYIAQSLY